MVSSLLDSNTHSVMKLLSQWIRLFQKCLTPNLPEDLAISFYIQSHKLIFAVYQLSNSHGAMKYDTYQAECTVPWLNEVLVLFTVALQLAQQLKDKVRLSVIYSVHVVPNQIFGFFILFILRSVYLLSTEILLCYHDPFLVQQYSHKYLFIFSITIHLTRLLGDQRIFTHNIDKLIYLCLLLVFFPNPFQ